MSRERTVGKPAPPVVQNPPDIVSPEEDLLWDIPTAAKKMSTTKWAIRNLIWSKQVTPIKIGKKFLIVPADLRAFIQKQKAVA
jgi:hypothetical protein